MTVMQIIDKTNVVHFSGSPGITFKAETKLVRRDTLSLVFFFFFYFYFFFTLFFHSFLLIIFLGNAFYVKIQRSETGIAKQHGKYW